MSAKLLLNSDLHSPDDLLTEELGAEILAGMEALKRTIPETEKETE